MRYWEATQCNPAAQPWELEGSPFPRTISVHRTKTLSGETPAIGDVGYSGVEQTTTPGADIEGELILYTNIPCSIQILSAGRSRGPLPADVTYKPTWRVMTPSGVVPQYGIRDRDILVDEENYRYAVAAALWTPMGWELDCIRLEA